MDNAEKQILAILQKSKKGVTINEIAAALEKERHTTAKYLEKMQSAGLIEMQERGKSKLYSPSGSSLAAAMKKNQSLHDELTQVFNATGQKIILKTPQEMEVRCDDEACCKTCAVKETFKTGKPSTSTNRTAQINAHPITKDNKVVAVVEIIKRRTAKK